MLKRPTEQTKKCDITSHRQWIFLKGFVFKYFRSFKYEPLQKNPPLQQRSTTYILFETHKKMYKQKKITNKKHIGSPDYTQRPERGPYILTNGKIAHNIMARNKWGSSKAGDSFYEVALRFIVSQRVCGSDLFKYRRTFSRPFLSPL